MAISRTFDSTHMEGTRKSEAESRITAAALIAILASFAVSTAQAQVVVQETFDDDLLKDPATTADWDTVTTELKLPTAGSLVPVQSLINSLLPTDPGSDVDVTDVEASRAVAVGDLDGDGFPDLAFGNEGPNSVYFNDGAGAFIAGSAIPNDGSNTRSVAIDDFNGDGHMDLLVAEFGALHPTRIHFNNGGGTDPVFTDGDFVDLGAASIKGDTVAAGDVDNDGDIDVVLGIEGGYAMLFRNDGYGNFAAAEDIVDAGIPAFGYHARSVLLGDLDRDGDLDLVAAREEDPTRIYFNDGSGVFGTPESTGGGGINNSLAAPDTASLGDVDGDGFLDLIVGNDGSGSNLPSEPNRLFLNSGNASGIFPAVSFEFTDLENTNAAQLLDVDRDGDLDIVTADFVSENGVSVPGSNQLYLNTAGVFPATGTAITADITVSKSVASGDFDRDGDLDLVFANQGTVGGTGAVNRIVDNAGTPSGINSDQLFATGLSIPSNLITIPAVGVVLETLTANESRADRIFRYWLSADNGLTWVTAQPGRSVALTNAGSNQLLWRVELDSPSPGLRPDLDQILITRNQAPVFDSIAVETAVQDVEYTYDIVTSDLDGVGDLLDIRATVLPAWLILTDNGDTTATLIGTPTNDDVGTAGNDVVLEVVDGAGQLATQSFTIDVADANDPPTVIAPTGDRVFDQGDLVEIDTSLAFEDIDGDILTYSATGLPAGLAFDTVTGDISGTLTNDDAVAGPDYAVVITADDGNTGTVDDTFTMTVNNINDAPTVIVPVGNQVIDQGTVVNLDVSTAFEDIDGDTLTYSSTGELPASLSLDAGTGIVTGTLTNDDVLAGPDYAIVITATEVGTPELFSVDAAFTLTVNDVNDAPTVIAPTGNQVFAQGDSVNLNTSTAFDDIDGDTLTYSAAGLPASLAFNTVTGVISGTLTNDDAIAGPDYAVVITADDGNTGTVDDTFTMTVNNTNDAPTVIVPVGDQVIDQGTVVNLDVSSAFEDIDGDTLTYTSTGELPASLSLDAGTGIVTGTLTNDDVLAGPDYAIVITATEVGTPELFSVDAAFTLTVNDVNDAPTVIAPTGNQVFAQGDSVNLNTSPAFDDIDGDTLTYSAVGLPASLAFNTVTGVISGTLTNGDAVAGPDYAVVITANDGNGGAVDDSFTMTVNDVNDPPAFTTTPLTAATEALEYSYSIAVQDIDGDTVVITSGALPGWLSLTPTGPGTAQLSGTPASSDIGNVNITLTADDGTVQVDQPFSITVVAAADAPVIMIIGDNPATVEQGDTYTDDGATANDAQDGVLTNFITVDSTVDTSIVGTYAVTYSVTDSAGNPAQVQRVVNVVDTAAPVITLNGAATVTLTVGDSYTDEGATADDGLNGDITADIVTDNPVDTGTAGSYTVTYNVTDASGNAATEVTRTVTVNNPPRPTPPLSGGGGGSTSLPALLLLAGLALGRRRRRQIDG